MKKLFLLTLLVQSIFVFADIKTDGLVFEIDAADPGANPDVFWAPVISGPDASGKLLPYGTTDWGLPYYYISTWDGLAAPCFKFAPPTDVMSKGGRVGDLGIEQAEDASQIFLPDKDFSIEIWLRPERVYEGSLIKENIFSTMDGSSTINLGYNISTRYDTYDGKLRLESHLATSTGTIGPNRYYMLGPSGYFTAHQWHQVVLTFAKDDGFGDRSGYAEAKWYIDGTYDRDISNESRNDSDPLDYTEFITPANQASIGARCNGAMQSPGVFKGKIAVVRVYDTVLSLSDIQQNYNEGIGVDYPAPGLVFSLDASDPGHRPDENWEPVSGGNPYGGDLVSVNSTNHHPVRDYENVNNQALWYYEFAPSGTAGGQVGHFDIPAETFDLDKDFTVEMWIKPGGNPASGLKEFLFGTRSLSKGFYLGTRFNDPSGSTFMFESSMTADNGTKIGGPSYDNTASINQWTHVVYVFEGSETFLPQYAWYIDGGADRGGTVNCYENCSLPFTGDFVPREDTTAIGAEGYFNRSDFDPSVRGYFRGKIAKLNVYDYALNQTEVQQLYQQDVPLAPLPEEETSPYVTDRLVFFLDADDPGSHLWKKWSTEWQGGGSEGDLIRVNESTGDIPTFECEPNSPWYFNFKPSTNGGSQVARLGVPSDTFDVDRDFTVELWFRPHGNPVSGLKEFLFGTITDDTFFGTGFYMGIRWDDTDGNPTPGSFRFESFLGSESDTARLFGPSLESPQALVDQWMHVTYVFQGSQAELPQCKWYVNGGLNEQRYLSCTGNCALPLKSYNDFVPDTQTAAIGTRESVSGTTYDPGIRGYFNGDVALCRVYDRALSESEVNQNYLAEKLKGDIDDDKIVGVSDIAAFADSWLTAAGDNRWTPAANLYFQDDIIDLYDFALLADKWNTDDLPLERVTPPFKVLYNNDFTNAANAISPFHEPGEQWSPPLLKGTINETVDTGTEVHLLSPGGHAWVPWWISRVYPMQEHYDWWYDYTGGLRGYPSRPEHEYLLGGYDPVELFMDYTRNKGQEPFFSFRLNDGHHLEKVWDPADIAMHTPSRFYVENPDYQIGEGPYDIYGRLEWLHDWSIPEAREYKISLIKEVCEKFNMAGFEIDFMRHHAYFNMGDTTSQQRKEIMLKFIRQVRVILDRTSVDGKYRYLCVRIPCYTAYFDNLGIDLPAWTDAGVDMVNVSPTYFTIQQNDMAEIKQMVPDTAVYLEMCHTTRLGQKVGSYESTFRRTTPLQYYTAAHLAYSRGLDGMSLFNFVYYRDHASGSAGPYNEPPFEIIQYLDDPQWLASQPQHYIFQNDYDKQINDTDWAPDLQNGQFPDSFSWIGSAKTYYFDMAPPAGGWSQDGRLRIQCDQYLENSSWSAKVNNVTLTATSDVSEPYPNPYTPLLGEPQQHRAWIVPHSILNDGINEIRIQRNFGSPYENLNIVFIDLAIE